MTTRLVDRSLVASLLMCALGTGACTSASERTQVMLIIDAEPALHARIHEVDLAVKSGTGPSASWTERYSSSLTQGKKTISWPLEVALQPRAHALDRSYLVVVTARDENGNAIAQLQAISGYVQGRSLSLPLLFDGPCLARDSLCGEIFTCRAGDCVDAHVPVTELLPLDSYKPATKNTHSQIGEMGGDADDASSTEERPDGAIKGGDASRASRKDGGSEAGCDAGTACMQTAPDLHPIDCSDSSCAGCLDGFIHDEGGAPGCSPLLTALGLSRGVLSPALNPHDTQYRVELPLLVSNLSLTPLAADDVQIELNGVRVNAREPYMVGDLSAGDTTLSLVLTTTHASRTYMITIARVGAQHATLRPAAIAHGDAFGASIAVDGDTVVVGAPFEDSSATGVDGDASDDRAQDSGAAYVFVRQGPDFVQQAYLKPATQAAGAHFGYSVAISGDLIAVGAPAHGGGSVYVFARSGAHWQPDTVLGGFTQSDATFGKALALRQDTLVVGAPGQDQGATDTGTAYVFVRASGAWSNPTPLPPPGPQSLGWFGTSVALDGDVLAIGATGESYGGMISNGAAYVYSRDASGTFVEPQRLLALGSGDADFLGEFISIAGDALVVGATGASPSATGGGAAYVFARGSDGKFAQQAQLGAGQPSSNGHFGLRGALSGDTLLVSEADNGSSARGINGESSASILVESGAVYLLARRGNDWTQVAQVKANMPAAGERYGASLARIGDSLLIGAPADGSSDASAPGGSVYIVE